MFYILIDIRKQSFKNIRNKNIILNKFNGKLIIVNHLFKNIHWLILDRITYSKPQENCLVYLHSVIYFFAYKRSLRLHIDSHSKHFLLLKNRYQASFRMALKH